MTSTPNSTNNRSGESIHSQNGWHAFEDLPMLICSILIAQVLFSNKVLFRLEIQRVDFLRSGIAQQEWRSVWSEAHPGLKV